MRDIYKHIYVYIFTTLFMNTFVGIYNYYIGTSKFVFKGFLQWIKFLATKNQTKQENITVEG